MCTLSQSSIHILTHFNPHNSDVGIIIIIIIILKLMKAADPSAEKDMHTQFFTQIRGSHTATLPNLLSVAIKSSTPDNSKVSVRVLPAQMQNLSNMEQLQGSTCLVVAASTAVAAVLGVGVTGQDGDLGKIYARVVARCWTWLDPNDLGPWKEVLPFPSFLPQEPCFTPFSSRRNRQNPGCPLHSLVTKGLRLLITHHHGAV